MRSDVAFTSSGLTCRGWLYRPQGGGGEPRGAIVMSHGFSAVKEQGLDGFARGFCEAGFVVLAYDHRYLGASDGAPRGRIVPQEQHDDARAALDWISRQEGVDPDRLGIWGSSYSGGHALFLGAMDPRIKVVSAQVPAICTPRSLIAMAGREGFAAFQVMLAQDHAVRNAGGEGGWIPVVAPEGEPSVLSTPDSWAWFIASGAKVAPNWLNRTSLESVARLAEYFPAAFIDLISPKPLLVQAAVGDALVPIDQVREAFARAGGPKRLVEHDAGHFDLYPGEKCHGRALAEAVAWFVAHL